MRKDVLNELDFMRLEVKMLMNKSEIARRFNCNRRTVDKYIDNNFVVKVKRIYASKLDSFKGIIIDKVDTYGANARSIYKFIKQKGYTGKYGIVSNFVKEYKQEEKKKATIRFETTPGLQAQVDWKESFKLVNKHGEIFEFNVFLMILGYSRYKYFEVTDNRNQQTLFQCILHGLAEFKGVPKEILFDNMATVVDRTNSTFKSVVINETFRQFAKEVGFTVITCRPYRPQTKGKVESTAKLIDRLKVYNAEFESFEDIKKIVYELNNEVNNEEVSFMLQTPTELLKKETEYLLPMPAFETLSSYFPKVKEYKVSKESMITYKGKKYSVPIRFIGEYLSVQETEDSLNIYYTTDLVVTYTKTDKYLNYKKEHAVEILNSDAMKYRTEKEIEKFIEENLKTMDIFLE